MIFRFKMQDMFYFHFQRNGSGSRGFVLYLYGYVVTPNSGFYTTVCFPKADTLDTMYSLCQVEKTAKGASKPKGTLYARSSFGIDNFVHPTWPSEDSTRMRTLRKRAAIQT